MQESGNLCLPVVSMCLHWLKGSCSLEMLLILERGAGGFSIAGLYNELLIPVEAGVGFCSKRAGRNEGQKGWNWLNWNSQVIPGLGL